MAKKKDRKAGNGHGHREASAATASGATEPRRR